MPKSRQFALFVIFSSLFVLLGCEPGNAQYENEYDYEYYDLDGYGTISSCRVYYPASLITSKDTYPAVTLSGGMTSSKEDMYWLAEYLSRQADVIVFAISASNNMTVGGYTEAHLDGYDLMVDENSDSESIVYQKIHSYGLMGFSMGGGGVLNAGNELGDNIDAIVAMAPFNPDNDLSAVEAGSFIVVGSNDSVAIPLLYAEPAFENLPDTMDKCLMELEDFMHGEWSNNNSSNADTPKLLISDWLDMEMNGNTDRIDTFLDPPDDVVLNWNNLD
jgi:pimeloyl-ACP methyl ester carboxylesterase